MIAITGGAGFIGSALIWKLNSESFDDILVVDLLKEKNSKNLTNLKFQNFMDKNEFVKRIEKGDFNKSIEGILHIGACSSTTEKNKDFLLENNYEYTRRLCSWSINNKKRFVYASSAATYGDGSKGFSDEHNLLSDLKPLNMYAYSKQLFDSWAFENKLLDKIAGLKYFNVFGPNEYHKGEMRSVVHKAFGQIKSTGKVRLFKSYDSKYKDGGQLRDFIYVKNTVDITIFIYEHGINGIFNAGTGKARSFYDLVVSVFNAMKIEPKIEYFDMPSDIKDKYQYFTQADITKLRNAGYKKEISSLEESITDYVRNYLMTNNPYLKSK